MKILRILILALAVSGFFLGGNVAKSDPVKSQQSLKGLKILIDIPEIWNRDHSAIEMPRTLYLENPPDHFYVIIENNSPHDIFLRRGNGDLNIELTNENGKKYVRRFNPTSITTRDSLRLTAGQATCIQILCATLSPSNFYSFYGNYVWYFPFPASGQKKKVIIRASYGKVISKPYQVILEGNGK